MASFPIPSTSFVGRAQELAEATALLVRPDVRLLVMTGPGGVGKTRLALAAVEACADRFRDGTVVVDLAPLTDAARFLPQLAAALGLPESNAQPPHDRLVAFLRTRRKLVVLDNFETVVAAAADLAELAATCRGVSWLVTTRVRPGVPGELDLQVGPLALAPSSARGASTASLYADAVRLFIERARTADPALAATAATLPVIAEICRRLDGLPLAIELAAARLRTWSCAELLARLSDPLAVLESGAAGGPKRLRTMRDAVAWSYDLLPPDLQALARRLAVFRGGFDLLAAEAVTRTLAADSDDAQAGDLRPLLNQLNILADHQLIQRVPFPGSHRWTMLEVIREFGWERLVADGDLETVRRRHSRYFLALAERTRPRLSTHAYRDAISSLVIDQHNHRAALLWAEECHEADIEIRLTNALWEFWYQCGFVAEGRTRAEAALKRAGVSPADRQQALTMAGFLAWLQGDNAHARERCAQARVMALELGSPMPMAAADYVLALIAWRVGDPARMKRHALAAIPVFRANGDKVQEAISLVTLAIADRIEGRLESAARLFDQARRLAEQTGFLWLAAAAGFGAGEVALDRGNEADAIVRYRESLGITAELGDHWGIGAAVGGLACIAAKNGIHDEQAARLFAAADAQLELGRTFLPTLDRARYERLKADVRRRLGVRKFGRAAAGRAWTIAEIVAETAYVGRDGRATVGDLTRRQREVLRYLGQGLTSKEIAGRVHLSEAGVNHHVRKIYERLGVHSRAAAAAYARDAG